MLLEVNGEITPERMEGWIHPHKPRGSLIIGNLRVIEARFDTVKSNIA